MLSTRHPVQRADSDNRLQKRIAIEIEEASMTITLDLKPEIEQRLVAQARERGVSLDAWLQEIVSRQARMSAAPVATSGGALKLPSLRLGAMSSLHRRDIYDDSH
jgi:hypothetical protein